MSAPGYPEYLDILYPKYSDDLATAVREDRCLQPPIGCGQPLIAEDGTARTFWNEIEADGYEAEWRETGFCPDCQDSAGDGSNL
ncbi:hypothetical protein OG342_05195 [Streptomyces bobili]|uniref:hypothetical protein n=1 Tax=Streptomyces bobili TaxID=67280 RepID=UPI00224F1E43|nr:hypothetical protein [Streptomyces bobili]MCX5522264.1 hypothetical protein [Streptomyces bobili]